MLNVTHHGWATKNIFHSRSPKTAVKGIYLSCYLKNVRFASYSLHFYKNKKKNCICVKNQLKTFLIKLCGTLHTCRKRSSTCKSNFYFYQQQVVYFEKHPQIQPPQETQYQLPLNVRHCCQKIKFAAGAKAEPLKTSLVI